MRKEIRLVLLTMLWLFGSCSRKQSYDASGYVQHLEDPKGDYRVQQVIGSKEYTIQLAPPDYLLSKESADHQDSLTAFIARRKAELEGYMFFLVRVGNTEQSRLEQGGHLQSEQQMDVNGMVAYYDQQAAVDISLQSGGQTLHPATYLFENNYGLSPYNTIVVGFETGESPAELTFNFNDRYTDIPAIRATFSKESIEQLPTLTL
jgi:hypothetical protein